MLYFLYTVILFSLPALFCEFMLFDLQVKDTARKPDHEQNTSGSIEADTHKSKSILSHII